MRVAVQREEAARFKRAGRQRVVHVLSCRVAINLNRDAAFSSGCEHRVPIGDATRTRSGDPTARMGKNLFRPAAIGGVTVAIAAALATRTRRW
jgi:hypothetical protein